MTHTLLVTDELAPGRAGGVGAWSDDAARALCGAGHRVTVVARAARGLDTRAWDRAHPATILRAPGRAWGRWGGWWALLRALPVLPRVDRVLCASWPVATALAPVARRLGPPVVVAAHGSELTAHPTAPPALGRVGHSARWAPVSAFLGDEVARLTGAPAPAPLPLPLPWAAIPVGRGPRRGLLAVARGTALKGLDRAARLAAALGEPLTVLGAGPEASSLAPGARFAGAAPRAEVWAAMGAARAVVLLSRAGPGGRGAEGLGLCLVEAAACGTPAIGAPTGGIPEAVGPGLLLADADAPDLGVLQSFLADPTAGARARAWVEATHGPVAFVAALRARWAG